MKKIAAINIICVLFISFNAFSQNVGIGNIAPAEKLHVTGNIKADTIKPNAIKLTPNAGTGKILTSDATGNANWQTNNAAAAGNIGFGVWGDCATNGNISEYYPVADATGASGDRFGGSVSVSGNYAIAGAFLDDGPIGADQGSVSIYQYNGSSWILMQKITDATGAAGDQFGFDVSISGNYAVAGAPFDDGPAGADQGSVSIYFYNGSSWVLSQKITDAAGAAVDLFGRCVSISGSYVIAGAPFDDGPAGADQGSVSIYQYNGSSWVLMQKQTDGTGAAGDGFGFDVSISGNYAIVGAWLDDGPIGADQGSVSIYLYNGSSWILMQKLTDANGAVNDNFGEVVSISGSYAIVGVQKDDGPGGVDQGSVSFYQYNGANWIIMQKLIDANGAALDQFGACVSISGDYAIVGTQGDDGTAGADQGSVTIFQRVGLGWQRLQYVTDPGAASLDYFGVAVAIDGITKRFSIGSSAYANATGKVVFGKIN